MAEGHRFPHAFLFRQKDTSDGVVLSLFQVRLEERHANDRCRLEFIKTYRNRLPGRVKMVYQFPDRNAFAVSIDHPRKHLLWDNGSKCIYYDLKNEQPMIVNFHQPMVLTWSMDQGVGILFPENGKEIRILKNMTNNPVKKNALWVSRDGKAFFIGLIPNNASNHVLLKVTFDSVHKP